MKKNNISEKNDENDENWVRVEMLKSGIVNGVRFPEGCSNRCKQSRCR